MALREGHVWLKVAVSQNTYDVLYGLTERLNSLTNAAEVAHEMGVHCSPVGRPFRASAIVDTAIREFLSKYPIEKKQLDTQLGRAKV